MSKLKVKGFGMTAHFSMSHGNTSLYTGTINQPGHELHGKLISQNVFTPKKRRGGADQSQFGKPETTWSVDDGSDPLLKFDNLQQLMDHFKLKSEE